MLTLNFWSPVIDQGLYIDSPDGVDISVKYCFKTIILTSFFLTNICLPTPYLAIFLRTYIYGFITGVFIHGVYSFVQLIFWYFIGGDIQSEFLNSIGITKESVGHDLVNIVAPGIIRVAGIHWDPAFFGLWGAIVILLNIYYKPFLSKFKLKHLLIAILWIAWIMTFSRTGYFGVIMTMCILSLIARFNPTVSKVHFGYIVRGIVVIVGIGFCIYLSQTSELRNSFDEALIVRFSHNEEDEGTGRHLAYPIYTLEGMLHDPVHLIMGYGARNSSRAIYYSGNIPDFVNQPEAFDIESDLCKVLANYGLIGFLLFLYFNYRIVFLFVKRCDFRRSIFPYFYLISIVTTFFAGFFYTFNDSRWIWIIYFSSLIFITRPDICYESNCSLCHNCKLQYS